ncbi:MAG: glycosyltransferase [Kiritimatiellae bacterium]|nr:glycosyltransferase [Kiritimatiellia bacterium]
MSPFSGSPNSGHGLKIISIITVAYNESENLRRLKQSIDGQVVPHEWRVETVLVDNGSHDETRNVAVDLGFSIVVLEVSPTVAACRNRGIFESNGDIITFVDADCELEDGWVKQVIDLLGEQDYVIAGWPVSPPSPTTWVQLAWNAHWVNKRGHHDQAVTGERAMTLITTANMSMNKSVMERVGGFDESLRSGEDMNFLLRAHHKGIDLRASPLLRVIHHGEPRTLKQFYKQQRWHCSKNSFIKILLTSGGRHGGNAFWYTMMYTGALTATLVGCVMAAFDTPWWLMAALPLCALVSSPAMVIAWRAKQFPLLFQLPILYFIYGWVRMCDSLGLVGIRKRSWRRG